MDKKLYASYEKTVQATVIKTTHTVRIHLNETAASVINTLKRVPQQAVASMIIGDGDNGGFPAAGEIIFIEENIKP